MMLIYKVHQSPSCIFEYLSVVDKFVSVHPLITKINKLEGNNYFAFETLKIGYIPFSFSYPVSIISNLLINQIQMNAHVMKHLEIELKFKIIDKKEYSLVVEELNFKTLFPIHFILRMIFKKQHDKLFENINQLISYN